MAAIAEPLIYVLFGEKWIGATLVTQVLCFAGLLSPLHQLNLNVLMAQGHSKLFFWLDVVKKIIGITLLLIGSKFGVMGVAWSLLISGFIAYLINTFYTKKFIDYGAFSQIRDFLPVLIISLIMSLIVYCINIKLNIYIPIKLILLIVIGALIFSTLALVFKIVSVRDLYKLISLNNNSEKFL